MKKSILLIIGLISSTVLFAQEKMYIHKSDKTTLGALISMTDSVYFSNNDSIIYFRINDSIVNFRVADIDSISFGADSNTVTIQYNGTTVAVTNPMAFEGVSVSVNGADVTVINSTDTRDINYQLSGTTTDGMFKVYSAKRYYLLFNGVNITNPDGPAINLQSDKKAFVTLVDGTTNTLTDGTTYANPIINSIGETEDQKAVFFSEGKLEFSGSGSLTINGKGTDKHALDSDDVIDINSGTITITSALNDGIHAKDGVSITGGTIDVKSTGDAIDGDEGYIDISGGSFTAVNTADDAKGMVCDSTMTISGGTLNITMSGKQSKGLRAGQCMTLSGGTINITSSGGVYLAASGSGYDPSYSSAIKCDTLITMSGADMIITCSGVAGKGISSDQDLLMTGGTVRITNSGGGAAYTNASATKDAYNATGITADRNINIEGGTLTVTCSGAGGKGLSSDGTLTIGTSANTPTVNLTTTGNKITIATNDYAEAKTVKSDGAITVNNGIVTLASNDDGLKSEASITINGGTVNLTKSVEGMEAPVITVNNGNVSIVASDDSFNATQGNGGEANDGSYLNIHGGSIMANSTTGDALDSNGNIVMTGGTIVAYGPQREPEVGMDYNGSCNISGGLMIVSGINSNMTQGPSTSSSQYSLKITANSSLSSTTLFHIQDADGNSLVTFKPVRNYTSIIFSSSLLKSGSTYYIYTGGSSTGTLDNGLYAGGTYSGGTLKKTFTVTSKVTSVSF